MGEDDLTRRVVEALNVQPESPRFFDELHARLERDDRRDVRRWRRAALAFALVAVAASVAAAIIAATPEAAANGVDRTVQCTDLAHGSGGPFFDVMSEPGSPAPHATGALPKLPPGFKPAPAVEVDTGETATLLTSSSTVSGYQLDRTRCAPAKAALQFGSHGLPHARTLVDADHGQFHVRCAVPKILLRVQIASDGAGIPLRAKLLVVRKATNKPLVYVDWARKHLEAWASSDCVAMQ
jgi:hypothetical protein